MTERDLAPDPDEDEDFAAFDEAGHDGDFDDVPSTHLDEEDYAEFVRRELDADGRVKGGPPVVVILLALITLVLALALLIL